MYSYVFIGNILDLSISHTFSNPDLLIMSCQIHLFVILLILLIADYYDLKFGIIPNKLSLVLLSYGLIFNLILSISLDNLIIFIFSITLTALITVISFFLWIIGFWGGGDFKLFIGLSLSLSFLDLNLINLNLSIFNQYPKVISILLNGILMALAFILISMIYESIRNGNLKLSILDLNSSFKRLTAKTVPIESLSEGMVLKEYYFKNKIAYERINGERKKTGSNINLNTNKEDDIYCFSSLNSRGLTKEDIRLINVLYRMDLIENPKFKIRIEIPFMPFITLGYIGFLIFGDFIAIISGFIKSMF